MNIVLAKHLVSHTSPADFHSCCWIEAGGILQFYWIRIHQHCHPTLLGNLLLMGFGIDRSRNNLLRSSCFCSSTNGFLGFFLGRAGCRGANLEWILKFLFLFLLILFWIQHLDFIIVIRKLSSQMFKFFGSPLLFL